MERHKMASTDETSPTSSSSTSTARRTPATKTANGEGGDDLEAQVSRLQEDVKTILQTLTKMGTDKVAEGQSRAKREYSNLVHAGEDMIESVQDEFTQVEKQIKDVIRQKPLTAVLSAIGIGFIIAVLTR
jgi:ElaB/YqjD/DUF883 family membrane-anchored ribosome-binding protein